MMIKSFQKEGAEQLRKSLNIDLFDLWLLHPLAQCAHPYIHVHIRTCMGTTYLYTKKEKEKKEN